jgi:hypothetical protein
MSANTPLDNPFPPPYTYSSRKGQPLDEAERAQYKVHCQIFSIAYRASQDVCYCDVSFQAQFNMPIGRPLRMYDSRSVD